MSFFDWFGVNLLDNYFSFHLKQANTTVVDVYIPTALDGNLSELDDWNILNLWSVKNASPLPMFDLSSTNGYYLSSRDYGRYLLVIYPTMIDRNIIQSSYFRFKINWKLRNVYMNSHWRNKSTATWPMK